MRGKKAKKIRKQVYGDYSIREKRVYRIGKSGGAENTGRRALYRALKKQR